MGNGSLNRLFKPEEYAALVDEADALFRNGRGADDVIQALAERIILALEQERKRKQRAAQMEGIAAARSRGVHLGRPKREPPANFPLVLRQYLDGNITAATAASLCDVAVSTFYRMKREAEDGKEQTE